MLPIINYARADVAPDAIEIRQEDGSASVDVLIPPPRRLQNVMFAVFWGIGVSMALAAALMFIVAMGSGDGGGPAFPEIAAGAAILGIVIGSLLTIVRIIQTGAFGSLPAVIRATDGALEVRSPSAFAVRRRAWPRTTVRGVEMYETGVARALLVHVRLVVILEEERVESVSMPWNGKGSLSLAENRLREALRLPPPPGLKA